jgi:hypothetical protein
MGIFSPLGLSGLQHARVTNIDPSVDPKVIIDAMRGERLYAFLGLLVGALVIGAGILLIFLNVAGQVDLTFNVGGNESKLNTAIVGIPMAIVGALIIYFTRLKMIVGKMNDTDA